jgi:hypothetical protein
MVQLGVPTPVLAAAVATFMELPVAFAVAVGAFTRPSALLMALYTLGTALIGHRYWTVKGADYVDSMDGFYKEPQHYGRLLAVVHYRCGKIFDRCIAKHRCAMTMLRYCADDATFMSRMSGTGHVIDDFIDSRPRRSITSSSMVKRLA